MLAGKLIEEAFLMMALRKKQPLTFPKWGFPSVTILSPQGRGGERGASRDFIL